MLAPGVICAPHPHTLTDVFSPAEDLIESHAGMIAPAVTSPVGADENVSYPVAGAGARRSAERLDCRPDNIATWLDGAFETDEAFEPGLSLVAFIQDHD
jgi:hypothetical protein